MTNFEYYVKGGKTNKGWCVFLNVASDYKGKRTIDKYNNWLLDEHKESILDDIEREYLSNVIKPFRDRVSFIEKSEDGKGCYIEVFLNDYDYVFLPYFTSTKMYAGMKLNHKYTLKELNL